MGYSLTMVSKFGHLIRICLDFDGSLQRIDIVQYACKSPAEIREPVFHARGYLGILNSFENSVANQFA